MSTTNDSNNSNDDGDTSLVDILRKRLLDEINIYKEQAISLKEDYGLKHIYPHRIQHEVPEHYLIMEGDEDYLIKWIIYFKKRIRDRWIDANVSDSTIEMDEGVTMVKRSLVKDTSFKDGLIMALNEYKEEIVFNKMGNIEIKNIDTFVNTVLPQCWGDGNRKVFRSYNRFHEYMKLHGFENASVTRNEYKYSKKDGLQITDKDELEEHLVGVRVKQTNDHCNEDDCDYIAVYRGKCLAHSSGRRIWREASKLDQTGELQYCLGMTPLHILSCSSAQNLELYQILIDKYPDNLITEDSWGAVPLLYAVLGNASSDVVQFLVESYQSIYPVYELNWNTMVEKLGRVNSPLGVIQSLLDIQKDSFPEQTIDWERVLEKLAKSICENGEEIFRFLIRHYISKRLRTIGLKQWREHWRDDIDKDIASIIPELDDDDDPFPCPDKSARLQNILSKLASYEIEFAELKESLSVLELALWKAKMSDIFRGRNRRNRKRKIEDSGLRDQCRINCGADIVIEHVLPYLSPKLEPLASSDSGTESDAEGGADVTGRGKLRSRVFESNVVSTAGLILLLCMCYHIFHLNSNY